jgi:hypothetical protein
LPLANRAGHSHHVCHVCLVSVQVISFKIVVCEGHLAPHFSVARNGASCSVNDSAVLQGSSKEERERLTWHLHRQVPVAKSRLNTYKMAVVQRRKAIDFPVLCSTLLFGAYSAIAYCDTDKISNHIHCVEKVLNVLFE